LVQSSFNTPFSELWESIRVSPNLLTRLVLLVPTPLPLLITILIFHVPSVTSLSSVTLLPSVAILTLTTSWPVVAASLLKLTFVSPLTLELDSVAYLLNLLGHIATELSHLVLKLLEGVCLNVTVVFGEACAALRLFHLALQFQRVTQLHKLLAHAFNLFKIGGWGELKRAKLLDSRVVEVNTILIFVVEGRGAVSLTTLSLLLLLKRSKLVLLVALSLRFDDLDLAFGDLVL